MTSAKPKEINCLTDGIAALDVLRAMETDVWTNDDLDIDKKIKLAIRASKKRGTFDVIAKSLGVRMDKLMDAVEYACEKTNEKIRVRDSWRRTVDRCKSDMDWIRFTMCNSVRGRKILNG